MGWFYPPPPVWVGGRQPFAPALGVPQSGPVPQAPPVRGPLQLQSLGVIVRSWTSPQWPVQGYSTIAPLLPAASNLPPPRGNSLQTILASWTLDPTIVITLPSAAGNVGITPDQPPSTTTVNLNLLVTSWQPPTFRDIRGARVAPLIPPPVPPDQPPVPSKVHFGIIRAAWVPPWLPIQGAGDFAPNAPPPPPDILGAGSFMMLFGKRKR